MKTVYIEDIADAIDSAMDSWNQFLNTETGEIVSLPSPDNMYIDMDEEDVALAEEIDMSDHYLRLPDQYDIHEYRIMERFAYSLDNESQQNRLLYALHGRKAYRRFKDEIINLRIDKAYYAFRDQEFYQMAVEWCEYHDVPFQSKAVVKN